MLFSYRHLHTDHFRERFEIEFGNKIPASPPFYCQFNSCQFLGKNPNRKDLLISHYLSAHEVLKNYYSEEIMKIRQVEETNFEESKSSINVADVSKNSVIDDDEKNESLTAEHQCDFCEKKSFKNIDNLVTHIIENHQDRQC